MTPSTRWSTDTKTHNLCTFMHTHTHTHVYSRSCPVNSMPDASSINIGNYTCLDGHKTNYMATSEDKFVYMTCPENAYRLSEDTYCRPCNVGSHYKATGVTSADDCLIDCKIRQYQNSSTTKQCTYCPPGHYMHNDTTFGAGSSFCKRCEVGKYSCPRHTGRRVWECGATKRRICHKTTFFNLFIHTSYTDPGEVGHNQLHNDQV